MMEEKKGSKICKHVSNLDFNLKQFPKLQILKFIFENKKRRRGFIHAKQK
jgi:hypothetical protein